MKKFAAIGLAVIALVGAGSPAFANGIAIEANGARAQSEWGGELGVGYNFRLGGLTLRPIAGAFFHDGQNDRYRRDRVSEGQRRCRDLSNGQFVSNGKCDDTSVKFYGKVEGTFTIPMGPEIGVGARFSSDKAKPYGTASFALLPMLRVKGNIGDDYYALGLRADF